MPAPDADPTSLAARVLAAVAREGLTIGTAESLTGGALCSALVDVPGASTSVRGAVVAYAPEVKTAALGVSAATIAEHGVVSEAVAQAMAWGARSALGVDVAVATTGVAGPGPQDGVRAGTVCLAVSLDGGARARTLALPGDRAHVRARAVSAALALVLEALDERIGRSAQR